MGERMFFPPHGVARVAEISARQFEGAPQEFYVFHLERGGTVWIPTREPSRKGLRPLMSAQKAKQLLQKLKGRYQIKGTTGWKVRAQQYKEALLTGSCDDYTAVLHELLERHRAERLTASEQRIFEQAQKMFVSEVATVLKISPAELESNLEAMMTVAEPPEPGFSQAEC